MLAYNNTVVTLVIGYQFLLIYSASCYVKHATYFGCMCMCVRLPVVLSKMAALPLCMTIVSSPVLFCCGQLRANRK